jgi:hypothetical protein
MYSEAVKRAKGNSDRAEHFGALLEKKAGGLNLADLTAGKRGGGVLGDLSSSSSASLEKNFSLISGWVYACLNYIANRVSAQPYGAGEVVDADEQQKAAFSASKAGTGSATNRFLRALKAGLPGAGRLKRT